MFRSPDLSDFQIFQNSRLPDFSQFGSVPHELSFPQHTCAHALSVKSYTPFSTSCHDDMTLLHLTVKAQTESAVLVGHSCCVFLPSQISRCSTSGKSAHVVLFFRFRPCLGIDRKSILPPYLDPVSLERQQCLPPLILTTRFPCVFAVRALIGMYAINGLFFFLHRGSLLQISLFFSSAGQGMIHPSKFCSLPSQKYPPSSSTALPSPLW